jgi:hypothetical protein
MNPEYLNLSLQNFLDSITNKKNSFTVKIGDYELKGTLEEIKSAIYEIEDFDLKKELLSLLSDKKEYIIDVELSGVEVYNYLEKITDNFDKEKTKLTLIDVESYNMAFKDRLFEESKRIYLKNGWEIPTEMLSSIASKPYLIVDNETMINKTHRLEQSGIKEVIKILKDKLTEIDSKNESGKKKNPYPELFSDNNYELFLYLNKEYTRDNKFQPTKLSNIYHFMIYENCISGTQKMYFKFIKSEFNITFSKILPKTYKYEDEIQPLLHRLKKQFHT